MYVLKGTRFERSFSPESDCFLGTVWIISGLVAFLVPLIYRTIHKNKYEELYMEYYWEQEYEYEMEQRKEMYEKYGNSYNFGGAYMYAGDYNPYGERPLIDVNNCRWWQLNCFSYYVNEDGEPVGQQGWYPNWYRNFATTEEERELMEQGRQQPGSLKFVYAWQAITFALILWYGLLVIRQHRSPTGMIIALLIWSNFAFLSMWLMADGSIVTEGQRVKRSGFYGQTSVLIFMSNFWYLMHALAFIVVFWIRKSVMDDREEQRKKEQEKSESNQKTLEKDEYQAPAVQKEIS
mmetsp:Transcript_21019/g.33829  ORF Transcript_21019/g.33829 Transcript_21019/m.33829 type:complete len:292 (-) Transcript_21019:108-983(-)